jgi:hypothetical protein
MKRVLYTTGKTIVFIVIVGAILTAASSCKTKEQKDAEKYMNEIKKTMKENSPANTDGQQKTSTASGTKIQGLEDIVGEWELVGFVIDTNDNLRIDEEERKGLKAVSYKDYMKLNSDSSGLFTIARMEGRYETNEKKFLTWYDTANGRHRIGTILSVTKDELQIKEPGGSGLFLWKRIK